MLSFIWVTFFAVTITGSIIVLWFVLRCLDVYYRKKRKEEIGAAAANGEDVIQVHVLGDDDTRFRGN